jgi:2',3'-cyclic-nucleotide 2'-phosphodiesterase (5'-nucleotidase family)
MRMNLRIKKILPAIMFLFLVSLSGAGGGAKDAKDAPQRLTILHTNDVHGHLRPFSYPEVPFLRNGSVIAGNMQSATLLGAAFDLPARRNIGGIARRATLASRIRSELSGQGTPSLLVDAGDFFYYSAFSNEYHGDADVLAMNQAGYDYATFGNHEFDVTLAQLNKMIADARFHFLCANVKEKAGQKPLGKRYEVRQIGAVRIGIFGLVESGIDRSVAGRDGLIAEDPQVVAPAIVEELRGQNKADIVILISHLGDAMDLQLARKAKAIDVIIGSHWHTRLPEGRFVPWSGGLKPDEVNGTVIVQAGQWGGEMGQLDLLLQKNAEGKWRVQRYQERLLPVTSETPEDPAVNNVLEKLWAPIAAKYGEVLANATADFAERGDDFPQNNLFADLIRADLGVEVEFEGTGGVHWPIVSGPVTREALVDLDQNQTTIVTFRMKGSEIRRFVQSSTPIASGLRYRMYRGKLEAITAGDNPLDDAHVYSCATSSSVAGRMNGFEVLEKQDTGRSWSELVLNAIRKARTIAPAYDGRRIVVDQPRSPR